ncbi:hypothetical protein [Bacillus massilinigeriensis]|uniref:hypothetical protein n=1 Tax=Bacillus massilionigeriensis TaxID=1805475 RepID=UPI00096B51CC|nr:hypothetical protein [Bacillus massilionigeriensis]
MSKNNSISLLLTACIIFLLTGCAYPKEKLQQNQVPYEDQISAVQKAVDNFQKDNDGILPIKTKDLSTPIYQKYPIDFKKLTPKYMAEPPGNAFESGGVFQYVLVDVEKKPTVKIFDLRIAETIRDLKLHLKAKKYPPYKEVLTNNVFSLDYKKLGYDEEPLVTSPYSNQGLPLIITGESEIYVDYRKDLAQALQKNNDYKPGEDIRDILVKDSIFVPAYSLPYTIDEKTEEPIFLEK